MTALPPDVATDFNRENARLQAELRAARDQQNASAEILSAIASTRGDAERSLRQIAEITARLFDGQSVRIRIAENGEWIQTIAVGASAQRVAAGVSVTQGRIGENNLSSTVVLENRQIHIPDLDDVDLTMADWPGMQPARAAGVRTTAGTPLRREGKAIGVLIIYRHRLAPFTGDELALLQSFADQAVIAIENARLFNETEQALARQTATSEILHVISQSPTDVQPVFDAIVLAAARLLGRDMAFVLRCDDATYWCTAMAGPEGALPILDAAPVPIDPDANFPSRAIIARKNMHLPDWSVIELPEYEGHIRATYGISSALYLPLVQEDECIGVLGLAGKQAGSLGESEIALAESFRDQALIAIENTRLFNETKESLERQNASADILRTIASTPGDAERALNQIAETCARLFGAPSATIHIAEGDGWARTIRFGASSKRVGAGVPDSQLKIGGRNMPGSIVAENRQVHVPDLDNVDPAIADWPGLPYVREAGTRSMSGSPLRREGKAIGALIVYRDRLAPFTAEELAVQQTFADQAAIAIENARLFNETREALERQTATADILKVIASSPSDVQPVFEAIAESAKRLAGGQTVTVTRVVDEMVYLAAFSAGSEVGTRELKKSFPAPLSSQGIHSRVARCGQLASRTDMETEPDLTPAMRELARARGYRSILVVPMLREGVAIGTIAVTRRDPGRFADHVIGLLETFADQAVIAIENTRLFNETREALERQTATAEILKVIASSPSDTAPVFEAIATSANRLLGGFSAAVFRFLDGSAHLASFTPVSPAADAGLKADFPKPLDEFEPFQLAQQGKPFPIPDTEEIPFAPIREIARLHGFRSMLFVPLMNGGVPIGIISVTRLQSGTFSPNHTQLLQTFADQAVIAIENARLFNETREALERQTATADILKVIASSPTDVQPVFEAIAASANRLIGGFSATVMLFVGDVLQLVAFTPTNPTADEMLQASFPRPLAEFPPFELVRNGKSVQFPDTESEGVPPVNRALARSRGYRGMLFTPLMNKGAATGILSVTRKEPGAFAAHHVQLLQTFADQAVIAIENVRLFDEVQARTRDLTESLQQQTATADVLKVISRSAFDLQTVLDTLVNSASRLCSADQGMLLLFEDGVLKPLSYFGPHPDKFEFRKSLAAAPHRGNLSGRAVLDGQTAHVADVLAEPEFTNNSWQQLTGFRAMLAVPLLRQGQAIGAMALSRTTPGLFADRQIELVTTFADQAVIAIENVRLFDEVQAKTRDLTESLQQQTATADVLKVISRSTFDLKAVLTTLVQSARDLCNAPQGMVLMRDGEVYRTAMQLGYPPEFEQYILANPIVPNPHSGAGRAAFTGQVAHFPDVLANSEYRLSEGQRLGGYRALLSIPLLREAEVVGVFSLGRTEPDPFTPRQIELVQTFADQAVIAIENVRLFDEVQARTRDLTEALTYQTGSSNILKVIASSPTDVGPVLRAIVESACELCEADDAVVHLQEGDDLCHSAHHGPIPVGLERAAIGRDFVTGRAFVDKAPIHMHDVLSEEGAQFPEAQPRFRRQGVRSILCVPLLRENESIGTILLRRTEVHPFSDKQIALLQTFADQAVIALGNVRLFEEVRERTKDLSQSLDELRTAQDRLVQTEKLASLGQLTAGIAHEIKNPLNFVNNFSALSSELTDELNDILKSAVLTDKIRVEVDELTGLLKDNLQKVVQHGKRADSIVKNMLLHSREGSGDHRPADINALLDESLNLAYHGARAEKPQFNVTLRRDFDETAGTIEVFPQEITRVFLNLISNGFYAVTKRRTENGGSDFEPLLSATTRNLGETVEIRIRDNGTGIPDEVKEKMFNPFFTTKPAGEGTGLGLSMSHDIIVKQHGGRIEVETAPGEFTQFTIVLPRISNFSNKDRG